MKKYFIAGDIHSFYDFWKKSLDEKGFDINNSEHIIVVLGDLFDRGRQSQECLDFVTSLPEDRVVLIRGNHETLLEDLLEERRDVGYYDFSNGTIQTILDLSKNTNLLSIHSDILDVAENEKIKKYYSLLQDYYMPDEHNVFCHGWLPVKDYTLDDEELEVAGDDEVYIPSNWKTLPKKDWEKATWYNGMDMWAKGARLENVTIWCGHWHTSWGHSKLHNYGTEWGDDAYFQPFEDFGIMAMDGCTAYTQQVNVEVLEVE